VTPYLTAAAIGTGVAGGILLLVRRDQLHGRYALWWLSVAVAALVLGLFPGIVDRIGHAFGVNYPPMLVVLLVISALLLKILVSDIDVTRRERRVRRLLQKIAIMEEEQRQLRTEMDSLRSRLDAEQNPSSSQRRAAP